LKAVKNKPEAIALLQTLSKYPNVVEAIKEGNIGFLQTDEDFKIFNTLESIDNDVLKVLVDYYSKINPKVDDRFNSRPRSRNSQVIDEEEEIPVATNIDTAYSDSGIGTASNITEAEGRVDDANEKITIAKEGGIVYNTIVNKKNKSVRGVVMETLYGYRNIVFKNRYDENKLLNIQGKKLLISLLLIMK